MLERSIYSEGGPQYVGLLFYEKNLPTYLKN